MSIAADRDFSASRRNLASSGRSVHQRSDFYFFGIFCPKRTAMKNSEGFENGGGDGTWRVGV